MANGPSSANSTTPTGSAKTNWSIGPSAWQGSETKVNNEYENASYITKGFTCTVASSKQKTVIQCLLLEQINFGLSANWGANSDSISKIAGAADQFVNNVFNTGHSTQWAGFATRRFYTGGSEFSITLKVRVVDGNVQDSLLFPRFGISSKDSNNDKSEAVELKENFGLSTIEQMTYFAALALPSVEAEFNLNDLAKFAGMADKDSSPDKSVQNLKSDAQKTDSKVGNAVSAVLNTVTDYFNEYDLTIAKDPGTVYVNVGDWFLIKEGVVTNVQFQPSKQMTMNGPLFCDITMTINCRENPYYAGDGAALEFGTFGFNSYYERGSLVPKKIQHGSLSASDNNAQSLNKPAPVDTRIVDAGAGDVFKSNDNT